MSNALESERSELEELRRENERLRARLDGQRRQLDIIIEAIAGPDELLDGMQDSTDRLESSGGEENILDRLGAIENRLFDIEGTVRPDPDGMDYEEMNRQDKARFIRQALLDDARKNGGRAKLNYREVRQRLDGKPSPGHAYDLMELAGEPDGFDYGTGGPNGEKRVTVDIQSVKDEGELSRRE